MPASLALNAASISAAPTLTSRSAEIEARVLSTIDELEVLECEWRNLWLATNSTPFQSPDWLIPFARHFTPDHLRVLEIRRGNELIGLAPFYLWNDSPHLRQLLLLGNGISDYLDVLIRPEFEADSLARIQNLFRDTRHEWNRCDLTQLPPNSPLLSLSPRHLSTPCPQFDHTAKTETNYAPAHQLEKLHYYRRRAAKLGALNFIRATPGNSEQLMLKLFDLHRARWNSVEQSGVLADPRVQQFHLEASNRMARSGMLRLYAATLNEGIIGVLYAFASHQRTCYYLSGFDPAGEKLSPGTLLIGHAIEEAIREGHHTFDFLRGREPYKYKWGAQDRPTYMLSIESDPSSR